MSSCVVACCDRLMCSCVIACRVCVVSRSQLLLTNQCFNLLQVDDEDDDDVAPVRMMHVMCGCLMQLHCTIGMQVDDEDDDDVAPVGLPEGMGVQGDEDEGEDAEMVSGVVFLNVIYYMYTLCMAVCVCMYACVSVGGVR